MWDIAGLYRNPPDRAVVLCADENTPIRALDRTPPILPVRPEIAEQKTHDYRCHVTTAFFAALDGATGMVIGSLHRRYRSVEFRDFLQKVDDATPPDLDRQVAVDDYGTHQTVLILGWLLQQPRFHLHFTLTYSSWINQVDRWSGEVSGKQFRRGTYRNTRALKHATRMYVKPTNEAPRPYVWDTTADQTVASIQRFYLRTSETGR